jgi:hypothetical protein
MYEVDWSGKADQKRSSDDNQFTLLCASDVKNQKVLIVLRIGKKNNVTISIMVNLKGSENCVWNLESQGIFERSPEEITRLSSRYSAGLNTHPNHLVTQLSNPPAFRRLKKLLPSDLPYRFSETTQILTIVFKYYF